MSQPSQTDGRTGDDSERAPGKEPVVRYLVVPPLRLAGNIPLARLNMAGWSDGNKGSYTCKTCNKQVHLSLSELLIFPQVKADKDLFQFAYVVPPHRSGGAFSTQICKGSETRVMRNYEFPTTIKTMSRSEIPTVDQDQQEMPPVSEGSVRAATRGDVNNEDVKKKVEGLSPQMAEQRYNFLLSRPISELTDEEYAERLALLERLTAKQGPKQE